MEARKSWHTNTFAGSFGRTEKSVSSTTSATRRNRAEDDLSDRSDQEIIAIIRERYALSNDPDYDNITINRDWYESRNPKGT